MAKTVNSRETTHRLTGLAILFALVFVLQALSNFVSFGPVSITLALTPILIGGAIYGPHSGAMLGFGFGIIVLVSGLLGWDKGFVLMLLDIDPVALFLVIFLKGIACGWLSALAYKGISSSVQRWTESNDVRVLERQTRYDDRVSRRQCRRDTLANKVSAAVSDFMYSCGSGINTLWYKLLNGNDTLWGVIVAGIVCPLVNTGIFIAFMLTSFVSVLQAWAGDGANLFSYAITAFIGMNFLVELLVNMILAAGITRIIKTVRK